jgi:pimeloyl-ACP methyl ester carboxylesterase
MRRDLPTPPLDGNHFRVHRRKVRDGIDIAYLHEGQGGFPVVLLHGWPGSRRLFWRNVEPLAAAGFEVIVPDARGFGESTVPPSPAEFADLAASARDVQALLTALGHDRCVLVGGDVGSGVCQEISLRFPGLVARQVLFNGLSPTLREEFRAAGISGSQAGEIAAVSDHMEVHGLEADRLASKLDSEHRRLRYVEGFFTGRSWKTGAEQLRLAGHGGFTPEAAAFQAAPFADAAVFRASMGYYEAGAQPQLRSERPLLDEVNESVPTMILYGVEDQIVGPKYTRRMEIGHRDHVGPFLVEESGHFVQWERADVLNGAVVAFCRDLISPGSTGDQPPPK